jgi:hypothetical protein
MFKEQTHLGIFAQEWRVVPLTDAQSDWEYYAIQFTHPYQDVNIEHKLNKILHGDWTVKRTHVDHPMYLDGKKASLLIKCSLSDKKEIKVEQNDFVVFGFDPKDRSTNNEIIFGVSDADFPQKYELIFD